MSKRWVLKTPDPRLQVALSNSIDHLHPILAQLLINRGIHSKELAQQFLSTDLQSLHDPFLLKEMDLAVNRINQAKKNNELVLIFGDYDVDGVTSSVILKQILDQLGIRSINYIPHRMSEGYGLNEGIALYAKQQGVSLLIAVDCGITAFEAVLALKKVQVDVIIFDHHEPSVDLPEAVAVVDPKRKDCTYPFKGLASVGLMVKLKQAISQIPLEEILDLAALGTIADVAELRGENRIFVKHGLPLITQTRNHGLRALLDVARVGQKKMKPSYVGFILGPRINASGRMDSAHHSLDLLLSSDYPTALQLAQVLEEQNTIRQKTQQNVVEEALQLVDREINFNEDRVIVVKKQGWHKGVLGIVASRLSERYYRPAIVISVENEIGTGSARSIEGFHLFEALTHCAHHLEHFGGHRRAAGLSLRDDKIPLFKEAINVFARQILKSQDLLPTLNIDAEIPLSEISMSLAEKIESLEPYGEGNPEAVFCARQVTVKSVPQILGKDTLKFLVENQSQGLTVIGFGMGKYQEFVKKGAKVDLAFQVSIDEWNNERNISLKLKDIKLSQSGPAEYSWCTPVPG